MTAFQTKTKPFDVDCQISDRLRVILQIEYVEGLFAESPRTGLGLVRTSYR